MLSGGSSADRTACSYRIKFFAHPGYLDMESDRYKRCVMIADIGTRHSAHTIKGHIDKMISGMDKLKGIYPKPVVEVYTPQDPENKSMRMDSHNELVGALQQVLNEHFAAGKGDGPDEEPLVTPYVANLTFPAIVDVSHELPGQAFSRARKTRFLHCRTFDRR